MRIPSKTTQVRSASHLVAERLISTHQAVARQLVSLAFFASKTGTAESCLDATHPKGKHGNTNVTPSDVNRAFRYTQAMHSWSLEHMSKRYEKLRIGSDVGIRVSRGSTRMCDRRCVFACHCSIGTFCHQRECSLLRGRIRIMMHDAVLYSLTNLRYIHPFFLLYLLRRDC